MTYDLFLNHVNGYRGHYAVCEQTGDDFNQMLLACLIENLLIEFGNSNVQNAIPQDQLRCALECKEAKIWQNEKVTKTYQWEVQQEVGLRQWYDNANFAVGVIDDVARNMGIDRRNVCRKCIRKYLADKGECEHLYKAVFGIRAPFPSESALPNGQNGLQLLVRSAFIWCGKVQPSTKPRAMELLKFGWT